MKWYTLYLLLLVKSRFVLVLIYHQNIITCSFFEELTKVIRKASKSYENFILMTNFSIDTNSPSLGHNKLDELCPNFDLKKW